MKILSWLGRIPQIWWFGKRETAEPSTQEIESLRAKLEAAAQRRSAARQRTRESIAALHGLLGLFEQRIREARSWESVHHLRSMLLFEKMGLSMKILGADLRALSAEGPDFELALLWIDELSKAINRMEDMQRRVARMLRDLSPGKKRYKKRVAMTGSERINRRSDELYRLQEKFETGREPRYSWS